MKNTSDNLPAAEFLPGLNGIRAIAAFLVISTHWPSNFLSLKFGWIGVNIFFVLSGFLITRILLREKQHPLKNYLLQFYYRRSLRIFPVYYLFLLVSALLIILLTWRFPSLLSSDTWQGGYLAVKHDMLYYLTYTYNLKLNLRYLLSLVDSSNQFFAHLWSLAVEEQFYLVFPLLVYFSSLRGLKVILITLIIICPLLRLYGALVAVNQVHDHYWLGELFYTNTFCQADALASGALLAVFKFRLNRPYLLFAATFLLWLTAGMACFIFLRKTGHFLVEGKSFGYNFPGFWFDIPGPYFLLNIRAVYQYTLVNALAVALILPAIVKKPLFPSFFTHWVVDYIGRISYGIYVFHNPLIAVMLMILSSAGITTLSGHSYLDLALFTFYCGLLFSIAHLSYRYVEKPILVFRNTSRLMNSR